MHMHLEQISDVERGECLCSILLYLLRILEACWQAGVIGEREMLTREFILWRQLLRLQAGEERMGANRACQDSCNYL